MLDGLAKFSSCLPFKPAIILLCAQQMIMQATSIRTQGYHPAGAFQDQQWFCAILQELLRRLQCCLPAGYVPQGLLTIPMVFSQRYMDHDEPFVRWVISCFVGIGLCFAECLACTLLPAVSQTMLTASIQKKCCPRMATSWHLLATAGLGCCQNAGSLGSG